MIILQILVVVLCGFISGVAYWLGGQGADGAKAHPKCPSWLFNRAIRHVVCPTMVVAPIALFMPLNAWLSLSWILMFGATTCYWNFLHPQEDKTWWNWLLHGLFIGLSILPYAISINHTVAGLTYAVACALTMCIWSEEMSVDLYEEFGRGFLMVAAILVVMHG